VIGAVLVAWTLLHRANAQTVSIGALPGYPRDIARLLFHDFLLPFEVTSVLILIAILGAVVLASRPEAIARHHHETETPKSVPELVGAGKEH
jgi:NADH:ubiquinone oxidoreductase subunit 6 (subunit J)